MTSASEWLDEHPVLGSVLKGVLGGAAYAIAGYVAGGSVPVVGAVAFGVAFAAMSLYLARRRG
jgi:outer membrane lipoprotein SlyB